MQWYHDNDQFKTLMCVHFLALDIDNIDYVTGIGNSSCEQYIRAGNPCRPDLQEKPQKCTKKSQNMAKNHAFFKYFREYLPNRNT